MASWLEWRSNVFFLICCFLTGSSSGTTRSDDAIRTLIDELRAADVNKAGPNELQLHYQSYTPSGSKNDISDQKLFAYVSPSLLARPTYRTLIAIFDNYNAQTGRREQITDGEVEENNAFLDAILDTQIWVKVREFLSRKGLTYANTRESLKSKLTELWFSPYSRARGEPDTSAFEHVFVGEYSGQEVKGLHNWVRFYNLELSGSVNYIGYVVKRNNLFVAPVFQWDRTWKPLGGFFTGTSPEFDIAVYTVCYLLRPGFNQCEFNIDRQPFRVTTQNINQNRHIFIGTAYPSAGRQRS